MLATVAANPSATQTASITPTASPEPETPVATPALASSLVLTGHKDRVMLLAWSPDGSLLASSSGGFGSADLNIRLWRPDGALAHVLAGHTQSVTSLAWSPDGNTLASASHNGTIRLWRPDGAPIKVLEGHAGQVFALAWSPDGKILASGAIVTFLNPPVQWWNGAGRIVKTLSTASSGGKFHNLAWSPDGRYLVGGATDYKEWDASGHPVGAAGCPGCTPAWGHGLVARQPALGHC